jgi:hypothetical protein
MKKSIWGLGLFLVAVVAGGVWYSSQPKSCNVVKPEMNDAIPLLFSPTGKKVDKISDRDSVILTGSPSGEGSNRDTYYEIKVVSSKGGDKKYWINGKFLSATCDKSQSDQAKTP